VGEYLLPASVTGVRGLDDWSSSTAGDIGKYVYVTTNMPAARLYAAMYPGKNGGTVYECLPEGDLAPDRDCDLAGISFSCAKALIIAEHPVTYAAVQWLRSSMMRASSSMMHVAAKAAVVAETAKVGEPTPDAVADVDRK
jgi:hypothetical protein